MTNDIKLQGAVTSKKAPKKKRKAVSLDRRKARSGWVFVAPFILGFIFVYFPIIFDSIKLSFYEMNALGDGYEMIWVGFENYRQALFVNPDFVKTLTEGFTQMIFDIPAIIIFSLFMAVLLNQKMAGRALFRAIFFIPVILSTGIMESIEAQNMMSEMIEEGMNDGSAQNAASSSGGGGGGASQLVSEMDIGRLFQGMIIGDGLTSIVAEWVNNIFNIVNRSGVQMLIFLAGLQSISPAIYESCQIDGATAWETFWKITFPMISPMILVNSVYTVIDSFTTESNTIMKFIDGVYQQSNGHSISAAMSWMYFLLVILVVGVIAGICSAFVFYQRRND